jgi:hypothetical protein
MKPNPPIKGHRLLYEGRVLHRVLRSGDAVSLGGCECGATPDGWLNEVSAYAMKQWHREHKAELRADQWTPAEWEAWHNPSCPPQEEREVVAVSCCLVAPDGAPEVGSIWMAQRSGRVVEVRAVAETNGVWQVETESHPIRSIRMAYTVADFLATFTPLPTGDR